MMIVLFISISLIPIVLTILKLIQKQLVFDSDVQDIVSINQLRRILVVSYDIDVTYDHLTFTYHDDTCSLGLINRKLIMKPGTQIFLTDIDDVYFLEDGGIISIGYKKEDQRFQTNLCLQQ